MNAQMLLDKLLAAGFRFTVGADGAVDFHSPDDVITDPNAQELYRALAWNWDAIHHHAAAFTTDTLTPTEGEGAFTDRRSI